MKRNRLSSRKAGELVYVHSNLRLLSHKKDEYKLGPTKLWDIEPEFPDLDRTLNAMSHMNPFDEEVPSSGHGSIALASPSRDTQSVSVDVGLRHLDEGIFDDM